MLILAATSAAEAVFNCSNKLSTLIVFEIAMNCLYKDSYS